MLVIANPLYDVVFKYLMEDLGSAKLFLSRLLDLKIVSLEFRPQEHIFELKQRPATPERRIFSVYRLDFSATVQTESGETKLVLIEIQKSRYAIEIMRFRRYLGGQYAKESNTYTFVNPATKKSETRAIPIITVYFLEQPLVNIQAPVLKVVRQYVDARNSTVLGVQDPFIESLTHDALVVQVSRLKAPYQTELERLLSMFDQHLLLRDDFRSLEVDETLYPTDCMALLHRLSRAASEPEMRENMAIERDIDKVLSELEQQLEEKDQALQRQEQALQQVLQESAQVLQEKDQALQRQEQALQESAQAIHEKEQALQEKDQELLALKRQLEALQRHQ